MLQKSQLIFHNLFSKIETKIGIGKILLWKDLLYMSFSSSFPGEKVTIGENYYATLTITPHYKPNL
jgi:hypothetical protein